MKDITAEVVAGSGSSYEVFWGMAQSAVIIFRQEAVVEVLALEENAEDAAVRMAKKWFQSN